MYGVFFSQIQESYGKENTCEKSPKVCLDLKVWVGIGIEPSWYWQPAPLMYVNPVPVYNHPFSVQNIVDSRR